MKDLYLKYDLIALAQDESFIRWVKNPEEEENQLWLKWLKEHPDQKEKIEVARALVSSLKFEEPEIDPKRTAALWRRIDQSTVQTPTYRSTVVRWIKYAAAAVVILALGIFFYGENTGRMSAKAYAGKNLEVSTPDGSSVLLNANSTITYKSSIWSKKRIVELEGEAFFEVEKGKPFIVQTPNGEIEVLGTSFNVDSYDSTFAVHCYTGRVKVRKNESSVIITAGEEVHWTDNQLQQTSFETDITEDWRSGFFEYNQAPLKEVFAEMERQFDVEIIAADSILERKYTGFYYKNNLDSALYLITWPMLLKTEKNGNEINIRSMK